MPGHATLDPACRIREVAGVMVLLPLLVTLSACSPGSEKIILTATDFSDLTVPDFAPYFLKERKGTMVLQVDADESGYAFGAAQTTFDGPTGRYDVTISTLGDADGVCQYKVQINGRLVEPTFTQPSAEEKVMEHTWEDVSLARGDTIRVMSNGSDSAQHQGGAGPNGFHMAHGRWIQLELQGRQT